MAPTVCLLALVLLYFGVTSTSACKKTEVACGDGLGLCCPNTTTCCQEANQCCGENQMCCVSEFSGGYASCCGIDMICNSQGQCDEDWADDVDSAWYSLMIFGGVVLVSLFLFCCIFMGVSRVMRRRRRILREHRRLERTLQRRSYTSIPSYGTQWNSWRCQGVAEAVLKRFPVTHFDQDTLDDDDANCVICLQNFDGGDLVRTLPCEHMYHQHCIDKWLSAHDTCPLCVQKVNPTG